MGAVAAFVNAHVVEQSSSSASMYATSMSGQHVALLVKAKDAKLKIDIKSAAALLAAFVNSLPLQRAKAASAGHNS